MPTELGVALVGQELEVIDPGARRRRRQLPPGLRVGVPADHQWDRGPERPVLVANLDPGEIERVEHELDLATHERRVDLVLVAVQGHRRGLGDRPLLRPQERLAQQCRGRELRRSGGLEPGDRRGVRLGVHASVVDDLKPGGEQTVQLRQLDTVVDLDQELIADGLEKPLDLPLRRCRPRTRVNQLHAQHRARSEQLRGHERRARSTRIASGTPRLISPERSAASKRNTSSPVPHRHPTKSRE